jgi:hypothetical protein
MKSRVTSGQIAKRSDMLEIGCRKCDLYDRLSVASLIEQYGADQPISGLLDTLANCPRRQSPSIFARCGAYWKLPQHDEVLRIVVPIIIVAALVFSLALMLAVFGFATPRIWAPRSTF